jgi:tRNA nucleotidyltransferase (CCA-adding enzyme)
LKDLKIKDLKFIGDSQRRIEEDPLRIIRALRFSKTLNLGLENKTKQAVIKNLYLIKHLTKSRIKNELEKIKNLKGRKFVTRVINKQIFA